MFNSRDERYRNPTGAIAEGSAIHFKISPERSMGIQGIDLIITADNNYREVHDMFWCGMNGDSAEWWECDYTPPTKGLFFYCFELKTFHGTRHIYRGLGGKVDKSSARNLWQITVYDKNFKTPDWLSGGMIYQIYPDRFNFSGKEKENVPSDRKLRDDWGNVPEWWPNEKGEITNSDYFKGDLQGVEDKLLYIKELGANCIYLNPIFEAHSNHRYDTADYSKIDPLLGTEKDFVSLCQKAEKLGMKIILDGVFNHTGSDSVYFNRERRYDSVGAYNSQESEYSSWYSFQNWNEKYDCWWGFVTLPDLKGDNLECAKYFTGENGIIRKWIKSGSTGWRLDVADELSDATLDRIYKATKETDPEAIVMGEVWEDASTKFAYGQRRRYLIGGQMDSIMNYPFREAILGFLTGGNTDYCIEKIENIVENYPPQVTRLLMNHIGTHDTERAITLLAGEPQNGRDRKWQSEHKLSKEQWELAVQKMKLASLLQFTLPGVPSVYYGDEAGTEGYKDPFNRACYPWGNENQELLQWYKNIAKIRNEHEVFKEGKFKDICSSENIMCYKRHENGKGIVVAINRCDREQKVNLEFDEKYKNILGQDFINENLSLKAFGYSVFEF